MELPSSDDEKKSQKVNQLVENQLQKQKRQMGLMEQFQYKPAKMAKVINDNNTEKKDHTYPVSEPDLERSPYFPDKQQHTDSEESADSAPETQATKMEKRILEEGVRQFRSVLKPARTDCTFCGETFKSPYLLRRHKSEEHLEQIHHQPPATKPKKEDKEPAAKKKREPPKKKKNECAPIELIKPTYVIQEIRTIHIYKN